MADSGHVQTLVIEGFAFGFVNSLHCAGMCGPLSAFYLERPLAAVAYHGARSTSYALVGAGAGAVGLALGAGDWAAGGAWFAIALALSMLLMALGFERWLGRFPGLGRAIGKVTARARSLPATSRAVVLGAATPLLPCGLLYAACAAAIASGGPLEGAASMAAFALGSVPLLLVAQWNIGWLSRRLGPARMRVIARTAMALAAALLLWRGVHDLVIRGQGGEGGCCSTPASQG
jgi:sulfite exporter TauE/SafE